MHQPPAKLPGSLDVQGGPTPVPIPAPTYTTAPSVSVAPTQNYCPTAPTFSVTVCRNYLSGVCYSTEADPGLHGRSLT